MSVPSAPDAMVGTQALDRSVPLAAQFIIIISVPIILLPAMRRGGAGLMPARPTQTTAATNYIDTDDTSSTDIPPPADTTSTEGCPVEVYC